jgi:tetratricopeptide (TPR) repeat protein
MADAPLVRHKTLFNLGIVYRRVGDTSRSIDNLKKASISGQAKAATANNLGLSYFDIEDYDSAMEQFEKSTSTEQSLVDEKKGSLEDLAFYYNNMGLCHYHQARKIQEENELMVQAVIAYDSAIKLNPDNAIHYFNRGNVRLH